MLPRTLAIIIDPSGTALLGLTASRDLLTSGRDTNDDALTPALVASLERGAHDGHVAGAVEGVVAAAVGHLDELVDDGLAALELGGVDEVGGAELLGPLLLGGVDVDDDDLAGLVLEGALDDGEADTAGAEDGHVGPGLHVGCDGRGAVARRDAAAEQARPVHGGVGLHGHHRDVRYDGVLGEGGRSHEVQEVLALALEPGAAIRHHTLTLRRPDLAAQIRLARLAELALLAFRGAIFGERVRALVSSGARGETKTKLDGNCGEARGKEARRGEERRGEPY